MLKLNEVTVGYGAFDVVSDLSVDVKNGELLCIIGPNGSGKSTLLKGISCINEYKGSIKLNDLELKKLKRKEIGKNIALLTQSSSSYFSFKVYDTVLTGRYPYIDGIFNGPSKKDYKIVDEALRRVNMYNLKDKTIDKLSGGQLQRVFLARLIAQEPNVILLDEPTNHLDLKYQIEILEFIKEWTIKENKISIVVLHDLNLVQKFADKVVLLGEDDKFCIGKTNEILTTQLLEDFYGLDVRGWMLNVLDLWR